MTTSTVWKATNSSYGDTCHFGDHAAAVAWARGGDVVPVEVQHYTPPALHVPRTGLLAEAVRMIQGYQRAGWLTNPAAGEQASDFIARASHEPPQPAEATECRYCDEVMKERDDYHEWADTLAYDIERLVGVEIGEHSNLNSPWGNAHDAAEYELDKRARKPHEPLPHQPISTAKETMMESVSSTSDERTVNNVMRHAYRVLSDAERAQMKAIKDKGLEFWELVDSVGASRELSLSKTASEEAVMWAVKHITR